MEDMKWISVDERLPEKDLEVLIFEPKYKHVAIASFRQYDEEAYYFVNEDIYEEGSVSHWAYLSPPKV